MSQIKMAKDRSEECDKMWIEPIKKLSHEKLWQPGEVKGKVVRQRYILPIDIKPG